MFARHAVLVGLALVTISPPLDAQDVVQEGADILQAILLPRVSEILRDSGVPVEEVESAIEGARQSGVAPSDATTVFEEAVVAVEESGPIENFGGFVQQQLEHGLRGRELADAIRAEHAARGIGPGQRLESARPGERRGGPPGEAGPGARGGPGPEAGERRPNERGPGAAGQRPDTSGARPDRPGGRGGAR
jgi:hypothetical protein